MQVDSLKDLVDDRKIPRYVTKGTSDNQMFLVKRFPRILYRFFYTFTPDRFDTKNAKYILRCLNSFSRGSFGTLRGAFLAPPLVSFTLKLSPSCFCLCFSRYILNMLIPSTFFPGRWWPQCLSRYQLLLCSSRYLVHGTEEVLGLFFGASLSLRRVWWIKGLLTLWFLGPDREIVFT